MAEVQRILFLAQGINCKHQIETKNNTGQQIGLCPECNTWIRLSMGGINNLRKQNIGINNEHKDLSEEKKKKETELSTLHN